MLDSRPSVARGIRPADAGLDRYTRHLRWLVDVLACYVCSHVTSDFVLGLMDIDSHASHARGLIATLATFGRSLPRHTYGVARV